MAGECNGTLKAGIIRCFEWKFYRPFPYSAQVCRNGTLFIYLQLNYMLSSPFWWVVAKVIFWFKVSSDTLCLKFCRWWLYAQSFPVPPQVFPFFFSFVQRVTGALKWKEFNHYSYQKKRMPGPSIILGLPLAATELQLILPASGCTSYCMCWNYHCPPNSPPHDLFRAGHSGSFILWHILAPSTSTGPGVILMPLSGHRNFLLLSPYHLGSPWGYPWTRCLGILLVPGCM